MRFKTWFENYGDPDFGTATSLDQMADDLFSSRMKNQDFKFNAVLASLGLPKSNKKPVLIGNGTLANVYVNPHNGGQIIKVTSDAQEARNFEILMKNKFQSPNIVTCYKIGNLGPTTKALLCDYIQGTPMEYSNDEFLALINGDNFDDYSETIAALSSGEYGSKRSEVFYSHNKSPEQEAAKLIPLMSSLSQLEVLGIDIFDFDNNVLDDGVNYVLVDLGQ
jgi:hypothetical protein